jgi:arylsulfatase A-like enzyme
MPRTRARDRPNVVVVLSDQHRADAMGCAGNGDVETPALDRLAEQGTRLDRAYATYPVCGPSRGCLITGQYPASHRAVSNDLPLPTDVPSVAEAFSEAGYRTGYVGKWHLDGVPRNRFTPPGPRRQGFDDFWAVYNCAHDYFNARYYRDSPELITDDRYEPVVQTDLAIEAIEEFTGADDDRPFCLFLSWGPPHDPYEFVPEEYCERYDPESLSLPENAQPLVPGGLTGATERGPPIREWGPTTSLEFEAGDPYDYDDQREILADYYAAVTALDDQFARLSDALDERGLTRETVLCYTSDHGDMLFSHGMNQKGYPHEESVNVPFIVRWPDEIPAGETSDGLFGLVDLAPTLLGLADVDAPAAMEGADRSALVRAESEGPESVFLVGNVWRAVRTDRYTYVRVDTDTEAFAHVPGGRAILWDTQEDPHQFRNVILDPEYADVVERLDATVEKWLDRTGDPFLSGEALIEHLGLEDVAAERSAYHDHVKANGRVSPEEWPPEAVAARLEGETDD